MTARLHGSVCAPVWNTSRSQSYGFPRSVSTLTHSSRSRTPPPTMLRTPSREHRPLGNQNRARKQLYIEVSKLQQSMNGMAQIEPTSDEHFLRTTVTDPCRALRRPGRSYQDPNHLTETRG
jgi:hypothetical protein